MMREDTGLGLWTPDWSNSSPEPMQFRFTSAPRWWPARPVPSASASSPSVVCPPVRTPRRAGPGYGPVPRRAQSSIRSAARA